MKQNELFKKELATREGQFQIETIERLKGINFQIDSAKNLVNNHVAFSSAFEILQKLTISDVRFLSMDFKSPSENGGNLSINLKGQGKNLAAVAFQSDILSDLDQFGLTKIIRNPMVTSPSLETNGVVSFGFSAEIDGGSLSYKKAVSGEVFNQGTQ
jgi:hypothetical protein